jgi:hypothetical protein
MKVGPTRPEGQDQGNPQKEHSDRVEIDAKKFVMETETNRGDRLKNGLIFSKGAGWYNNALINCNTPKTCNSKFSGYDQNNDPDRNSSKWNKRDHSDGDEDFICQRIKKFTQYGDGAVFPCEEPVQDVGYKGQAKEEACEEAGPSALLFLYFFV